MPNEEDKTVEELKVTPEVDETTKAEEVVEEVIEEVITEEGDGKKEPELGDSIDDFNKLLEAGESVSVDDFKKAGEKLEKKEEPKEEKKPEVLKDEKTGKFIPKSAKPEARDYSGVDEKIVPLLKSMSGSAFDHFKPLLLEHEKLKKEFETTKSKLSDAEKGIVKVPDNYYEHPRGFTLTPDFERTADNLNGAQVILEHWQNQLQKVREDKDTYTTIHINPESGEFYESAPLPIDANTERKLMTYVNGSQQQLAKYQIKIENLAKTHKETYVGAINEMKEFEKASFASFEGNEKMTEIVKNTISNIFPAALQSNPLAPGYAKALITINHLSNALKKATEGKGTKVDAKKEEEKKVEKKVEIDDDQRRAGPTSSHLNGEGSGNGSKKAEDFGNDVADFESVK